MVENIVESKGPTKIEGIYVADAYKQSFDMVCVMKAQSKWSGGMYPLQKRWRIDRPLIKHMSLRSFGVGRNGVSGWMQ